jgi:hypothetical protein
VQALILRTHFLYMGDSVAALNCKRSFKNSEEILNITWKKQSKSTRTRKQYKKSLHRERVLRLLFFFFQKGRE